MTRNFRSLGVLVLLLGFLAQAAAAVGGERFKKIDAQGKELSDDAAAWVMVLDTEEGLYWEVKSADDSIHSNKATYKFTPANEKFISKLNEEKFGGFDDWRLPTTAELSTIRIKENTPAIDADYFPNTVPSRYLSMSWCGSTSDWQEDNIKFGDEKVQGGKYVRAVRGKPPE